MRQLMLQVPAGEGARVLSIAEGFDAVNSATWSASDSHGRGVEVAVLHVSNASVGPLVDALEAIPELRVSLIPSGALALRPPSGEAADQVTDVAPRSPLEVYVAGLQSIGSWRGFLGYAIASGVVVWLGLVTNTVFLLVGAMLIAPFAGPAVNTAVATARGDWELLWRSLVRYGAALTATATVAALLSLIFSQETATPLMASVSTISSAAVVLPLAAGAAAALHLSQGDQSSLVSGAAAGILIAASLAPPVALVGMGSVTGDHELVPGAFFLLGLQLAGINLAGAVVFRLFGLRPRGTRYERGRAAVRSISLAVSAVALAGLLAVQFFVPAPELQRATLEQRMRDVVLERLAGDSSVAVVEADLRFTRADIPGQNTLLVALYVQRQGGGGTSDELLRQRVVTAARESILREEPRLAPAIAVTVLSP